MRTWTRKSLAVVALSTAAMALPAMAEEGKLTLGVSGGTLGVGPELAYRVGPHLGLRASGGFYNYKHSDDLDDIDYDTELKLNSFGAMIDWYPFGGGFRISAGARINNNEIDLAGAPTTNVEIGTVTYTPAQVGSLLGTITTDSFAPTVSLGYGGKLAKGFTVGVEIGVMQQGSPQINNLRATGSLAANSAFLQQLAIEEQNAEDDAHDFKLWPVIQIGLLYRF